MRRAAGALIGGALTFALLGVASGQTFRVSGTVVEQGASTPIPAAAVTLSGPGGDQSTTADATGAFEFAGLTAGDYNLVASASCYLSAQQALTVAQDETITLGLAPDRHPVSGTVLLEVSSDDPTGTDVTLEQGGAQVASASTDPLGRYEFPAVCSGTYEVAASRTGYVSARQQVVVSGSTEVPAITLVQLGPYTVSGTVRIDGGGDASGVVVRLEPGGLESAPTAADGTFVIEQVRFGLYTLTATKEGFEPARVPKLAIGANVSLDLWLYPPVSRRDESAGCAQGGPGPTGVPFLALVLGALLALRQRRRRLS